MTASTARLRASPPVVAQPRPQRPGVYVGRVERNLHWVTDGSCQSAFLTTRDNVVLNRRAPSIPSRRSSTKDCWSRITGSRRTPRGAVPE